VDSARGATCDTPLSAQTSTECKAYINQLQKKAPFASDRRFLGGEWLYKTSTLHKSEPVPDARYLTGWESYPEKRRNFVHDYATSGGVTLRQPTLTHALCAVYEKRPLTQSRRPGPYKNSRSTRQLVELIHQHMNTRSRSTKTASRLVDDKHPLRALMKADLHPHDNHGSKGYLTPTELKNCLDHIFCVVLDDDEVKRVIEQVPHVYGSFPCFEMIPRQKWPRYSPPRDGMWRGSIHQQSSPATACRVSTTCCLSRQ
jgi:hypothetical protein